MPVTVEEVRKALEDMVYANLIEIFMVKHAESVLSVGDNSIAFAGDPYDSAADYVIEFHEALDSNGFDIRPSLIVKNKTASGFVIETTRATTAKWISKRKTPKITFWT